MIINPFGGPSATKDKFKNFLKGIGPAISSSAKSAATQNVKTMIPQVAQKPGMVDGRFQVPAGQTAQIKPIAKKTPQTNVVSNQSATTSSTARQGYTDSLKNTQMTQSPVTPTPPVAQPTTQQTVFGENRTYSTDGSYTKDQNQPEQKTGTDNPYLSFLKDYYQKAQPTEQNLYDTEQKISAEQLRARQEEDRIRKNEAGALQVGVNQQIGELGKTSGRTLADLEISRSADENRLNRMMNAGLKAYEIESSTGTTNKELDKPISLADAQALGLPYGTTMRDAQKAGVVPTATPKASDMSADAKTFEYYNSLTPDQKQEFERLTGVKPPETTGGNSGSADNLAWLLGLADEAISKSGASGPSGAKKFIGDALVGDTQYRQLESVTNSLKTNVLTLMTDPTIKKFFGPQMSNADVQLMTSAGTSLNPSLQSPAQLKAEATRLKSLLQRMQQAVQQGSSTHGAGTNVFAEEW